MQWTEKSYTNPVHYTALNTQNNSNNTEHNDVTCTVWRLT